MGRRVTAYLATTWQLDGRKLQLKKMMDLLMVKLIRIQNDTENWKLKTFWWVRIESLMAGRGTQLLDGGVISVILSNHIRLSVRFVAL